MTWSWLGFSSVRKGKCSFIGGVRDTSREDECVPERMPLKVVSRVGPKHDSANGGGMAYEFLPQQNMVGITFRT